jgi:hypothetical protein
LRVGPKAGLSVVTPQPNSCVAVLASTIPPARRIAATTSASAAGTRSANSAEPSVVRSPPVSIRSLTSTGTPSSGRCTPRCQRTVDSYAAATASGYADVTSALISGSHASARAVSAASASTGDSSARAYPATRALADIDQIGSPGIDAPRAAHRQEL